MLSVSDAVAAVLRVARPFEPQPMTLMESLGLVLAGDIHSDIDLPPFDKSLVDGFAIRLACWRASVPVVETISAGQVPTQQLADEPATSHIMTGAPLPVGADAVVPIELTSEQVGADGQRHISIPSHVTSWKPGTNIVRQGAALKRGELVIAAGTELRPQELGALAELGHAKVLARRRPRVAVLATGDELVPVDQTPGPGQIRNSNETMLCAQIRRAGGEPVPLGIARDERPHLAERIATGLCSDVLVLSGGVSMGERDLVPSELSAAGVLQIFHKVNVKPGKPVWFGLHETADTRCLVFGLPGNPVSGMVCFELFVRPALRCLMGFVPTEPIALKARLMQAYTTKGDRPTYHPAWLEWFPDGPAVTVVPWIGSSDLRATVAANTMAVFPQGNREYCVGDVVEVLPW